MNRIYDHNRNSICFLDENINYYTLICGSSYYIFDFDGQYFLLFGEYEKEEDAGQCS
jgi:hypothetical protein